MTPSTLYRLIGQLHPAAVHFPVALLFVAALAWLLYLARPREELLTIASFNLHVGAFAALVATVMGWCLAQTEGVTPDLKDTLFWHRWLGTGTAIFSLLLVGLWHWRKKPSRGQITWTVGVALALIAVLVGATGHLGGTLVYGGDWYSLSAK